MPQDLETPRITTENGLPTLRDDERKVWDAMGCPDLVAKIDLKYCKELNQLLRRKAANRPEGTEERYAQAAKSMRGASLALQFSTTEAFLIRLMTARVERNLVVERALELAAAVKGGNATSEEADALIALVGDLRKKGAW